MLIRDVLDGGNRDQISMHGLIATMVSILHSLCHSGASVYLRTGHFEIINLLSYKNQEVFEGPPIRPRSRIRFNSDQWAQIACLWSLSHTFSLSVSAARTSTHPMTVPSLSTAPQAAPPALFATPLVFVPAVLLTDEVRCVYSSFNEQSSPNTERFAQDRAVHA